MSKAGLVGLFAPIALAAGSAPAAAALAPPTTEVQASMTQWLAPGATLTWQPAAGATSYDVRISRTPARSGKPTPWTYPAGLQGRSATKAATYLTPGSVLCASVRVHATSPGGPVTGPWSPASCVARAFPISMLRSTGRVSKVDDPLMFGRRALVTRRTGQINLAEVPRGATIGVMATHPSASRSLDFRFEGHQVAVAYSEQGDAKLRNIQFLVQARTPSKGVLSVDRAATTKASFPVQAIYVLPGWAR